MAWYYKQGGQEIGPVEKEELQKLINSKHINGQTLVRSSTMNEWKPLAEIARSNKKDESEETVPAEETASDPADKAQGAESAAGPPPETVICSQCGGAFPKNEIVTFDEQTVCAGCKPAFVQKIKEGAETGGGFRYAGFWIRFGAKIIDGLILYAVNFVISLLLGVLFGISGISITPEAAAIPKGYWLMIGIQQLVSIAIPTCYNTYLVGRFGATVGKMACGLKVITPSGGRISYPRALGRNFAEWISSIILSIGYIMAAFDSEKRALHDRICSTRVIYKK